MDALVLLSCLTCAAAFDIVPSKLQLFEYESVSFSCLGFNASAGFKVMNMKQSIPCSDLDCTIKVSLVSDSGEYWCEGGGERSRSVSITVTAGPVVLESPVRPVMEGDDVTLSCRSKMASSNLTAAFYKDGVLITSSSTGTMSLHSVSTSEEGRYRCGTGAGESAESPLRLTERRPNVDDSRTKGDDSTVHKDATASPTLTPSSADVHLLLWVSAAAVVVLELLVIGLLCCMKRLVPLKLQMTHPNKGLSTKSNGGADSTGADDCLSLSLMTNHSLKPRGGEESGVSSFQCSDGAAVMEVTENRATN
ncbi:uncharacterized protein LOC114868999 [Betta splendens]|uniref:Uncharacterized protein LOC114868999 n=1 Tax=Betta splendens TaxID=158456 RepID=A0A6P7P8H5_BETSP|nr:uncharacterized protein LOC114868999 [Betta splendens]